MDIKKNYLCGVCPGGCALDIEMEDGKIAKTYPAKESPYSAICLRGRYAGEVVYSEDRVLYPMIRTGEKGTLSFRRASWDEALDYIAEKFTEIKDKYGAEALFSHFGRGAFEQSMYDFIDPGNILQPGNMGFFEPWGSPNFSGVGSICYNSFGVLAPYTVFGVMGPRIRPDIENSDTIFVWGANPATDSPPFVFNRVNKAKKDGKRIIAVDHFKSDICRRADKFYLVRSGSDGALILGIISEIIRRGEFDKEFVDKYCKGFDELKEYSSQFSLSKTSEITGMSEEDIEDLVDEIVENKKSCLLTYTGLEYSNSGVQSIRAIYELWSILGRIDKEGTLLIDSKKAPIKKFKFMKKPKAPKKVKAIGEEEYPLFHHLLNTAQFIEFPKAVLEGAPYKIRGLLNIGSSISTSYPNTLLFRKALSELDFFCTIDRFMTEDAKYADVVLPATTYFENESYFVYGNFARKRERVIEPRGEAKADMFILHDIAERLGYGELYPANEEELLERVFDEETVKKLNENAKGFFLEKTEQEYEKYETGKLRDDGKPGFPTESGKIELKSSLLEEYGYPGLPEYKEPEESPISKAEMFKDFPIVLNTGTRIQTTFRSQHLNIEGLLEHQPNAEVLVNPDDAAERNISDNDKVIVSTIRGEQKFTARVTENVPEGEVELNMGGGAYFQSEGWKDSNTNMLTDDKNRDYISGFPIYKALLCEVQKA